MKSGSASVPSKQTPGGGFRGALRGTFGWQKSKRGCNVFDLGCYKVIHVHTRRTRGVLFALAEDVVWPTKVLPKPSAASAPTGSSHDVGSLSGFDVIRFTTVNMSNKSRHSAI